MLNFFKKLMEQALDLELTVRFTKQDGEMYPRKWTRDFVRGRVYP